jgi:predicted HicB family RNase H-like nuclease
MKKPEFPYRIVTAWSDADECYVCRAPAWPGLGAHGDTAEEAIREALVAGKAMLSIQQEMGRPVPMSDVGVERYSGNISLRLSPSLHMRLIHAASIDDSSLNQFIATALAEALGRLTVPEVATAPRVARHIAKAKRVAAPTPAKVRKATRPRSGVPQHATRARRAA